MSRADRQPVTPLLRSATRALRTAPASILTLAGAATLSFAGPAFAQATGSVTEAGGQADLIFWQSVSDSNDRAQYEAYLAAFPEGLFAGLARAKIIATGPALPLSQPVPAAPVAAMAAPLSPSSASPLPAATAPAIAALPLQLAASRSGETEGTIASFKAEPTLDPTLVEQLRAMAMAQGNRHQNSSFTLPPRPVMTPVGSLDLPPQFCSAQERNAFHESRYLPLIDRASQNNAQAIAHMELLSRLVAEAANRGDGNASSALARESRNYEPVAIEVYRERAALDPIFPRIMGLPVVACTGAKP